MRNALRGDIDLHQVKQQTDDRLCVIRSAAGGNHDSDLGVLLQPKPVGTAPHPASRRL